MKILLKKMIFFSIKKKENTSLKFEEFVVGYKNSFSEKKKIDNVNELKDKFTPKNYYKKIP